jgi:hypothetical protein
MRLYTSILIMVFAGGVAVGLSLATKSPPGAEYIKAAYDIGAKDGAESVLVDIIDGNIQVASAGGGNAR